MSDSFQEFERLLADPNFWEADLFMTTEEIVPLFDAQDWNTLRLSWHTRDHEYKERFFISIGDAPASVLVEWACELLNTLEPVKIEEGLTLLDHSGPQGGAYVGEKEIEAITQVWQTNPLMRAGIQQILWSTGERNR